MGQGLAVVGRAKALGKKLVSDVTTITFFGMTRMLNDTRNPAAARWLLFLLRNRVPVLGRLWGIVLNCDIHCAMPRSVILPHPYGIVIHGAAVLGEGVVIMQQVTIGARNVDDRAPVIEDNVFIGAGAKVLGGVRVGRHCVIGANAVVTRDLPAGVTVIGINEIIKQEGAAEGGKVER